LDEVFIEAVRGALRAYRPSDAVRGSTVIYSKILRVGRTREEGTVQARVSVNGTDIDLAVATATLTRQLYTLARENRFVAIQLDAVWRKRGDGTVLDRKRTRIASVDAKWRPAAGADIAREMRAAVGGAFDNLSEVEAILGIDGEGKTH
jgi:hypothetical protein